MLKGDVELLKKLLLNNEKGLVELDKDMLLQTSQKLDRIICEYQNNTK
ncbi:MAG: hypothetical protein JJT76_19170 [Clostridiaceae bacterium]|nr:hypothetical protein [Clostridiaceae bacterium]